MRCVKLAVVVVTWQDVQGGNPLDFSDPAVQEQMDESLQLFRDNEFVRGDTSRCEHSFKATLTPYGYHSMTYTYI